MRMKKKIIGILVDIILFGIVFGVTDTVLLKVFHSESFWLELGIYLVLYTIAFGTKRGIIITMKGRPVYLYIYSMVSLIDL